MRTYLECIPCFVRQTLDSVRMVTLDEKIQESMLRKVLEDMAVMDMAKSPPDMSQRIHRLIRSLTGELDPYAKVKRESNEFALSLYPQLKETVEKSGSPIETALRLAIAGNIIDFGVHSIKPELDQEMVHDSIETALNAPIDGSVFRRFEQEVSGAEKILYLADNAGEIAFDRLLIEQLPVERITVAVKGAPIINDATIEDARAVGLTELVKVIDNGSDAPGTLLESCSQKFLRVFDAADLVISKGQGNYETLSGVEKKIFYLLRAKCQVIARNLGVEVGSVVISAP